MPGKALAAGGPVRRRIAVSIAIGLAVTAAYGLQGGLLALLLAHAFGGGPDLRTMPLLLGLGAILLARALLLWGAEIAAQATARTVKEELRGRLLRHLFDLGPGVTLRRQTGELQAILVGGVEALESYHSRYLPALCVAVPGCGGILAVIAVVDWPSAALLCLFVAGFPVLDRLWLRWRMPRTSGIFAALGALGAYLLDSLQGIVTVKAFGASARRRTVLADHAAALRRESMSTLSVTLMRTGLTGFVMLSGVALVLSAGAWRVAAGALDPFALLVTLFLAREAFRPLERLEREFHSAWAAGGAAAPILDFLALAPPVREADRPLPAPPTHDIRFEDVTFGYADGGAPSLDAVSFHVAAHEHVALVGPSGAGKSTVVALLLRFFDPGTGTIRIGE
ncbi:ABC transporter transmembrane domain-containing protein, partial [Azospirillum sp. B506]|uniref:ABC transporter transmembrane domain-containing protein n=1 Tax=Azospirillum sp. B506 TaxID=137721 RepID=UPI0005B2882E